MREDYLVVKHNSLINSKSDYLYTTNQLKLICHLISHIKPNETEFEAKSVSLRDLGFVGVNNYNYTRFKNEFVNLLKMPFQLPDKKGWMNWFSYLSYDNGVIEYRFDPMLIPYLLDLKDNFTTYQLKNVLLLQSAYNIKLYELLTQYKVIGHRNIELDELREYLNIPSSYQNKDVIKLIQKLQKELEEKTDIHFTFEVVKLRQKFHSLEFVIKKDKKVISFRENLKSLKI